MRRREFLTLLGGAAASWPLAASGQQPAKSYRIAIINPFAAVETLNEAASPDRYRVFFEELRRLGYQEGPNLVVERYSGIGKTGHLDELLQTAAASKPDVILVVSMEWVLKATPVAIPIVEIGLDPIAFGLTSNLAHPDRNITGVAMIAGSELYAKHLELLRQASPAAAKVACLTSRDFWEDPSEILGPLREEAKTLGIALVPSILEPPYSDAEYRRVFATMVEERADGLIVTQAICNMAHQPLIVGLAASARLPTIYPTRSFVDQGGLMSYGAEPAEVYRRAATAVVEILRGEKLSDIPYYQASQFELVINLKTAKPLGLTMPQLIMARANDVIE
jgi:putative tryptophan/tyrosine transport system substrate-binding protein